MFALRKLADRIGLRRQSDEVVRSWRGSRPVRPAGIGNPHPIRLVGPLDVVSGLAVEAELRTAQASSVALFIDSAGGDLEVAFDLHWKLRRHPWLVLTCVEDEASSAALVVAQAGDVRRARASSRMLVHRASCEPVEGTAAALRAHAQRLDAWDARMAGLIAGRARQPLRCVEGWMDQEFQFSGLEAKAVGLIDQIEGRDYGRDFL